MKSVVAPQVSLCVLCICTPVNTIQATPTSQNREFVDHAQTETYMVYQMGQKQRYRSNAIFFIVRTVKFSFRTVFFYRKFSVRTLIFIVRTVKKYKFSVRTLIFIVRTVKNTVRTLNFTVRTVKLAFER